MPISSEPNPGQEEWSMDVSSNQTLAFLKFHFNVLFSRDQLSSLASLSSLILIWTMNGSSFRSGGWRPHGRSRNGHPDIFTFRDSMPLFRVLVLPLRPGRSEKTLCPILRILYLLWSHELNPTKIIDPWPTNPF